VNCLPPLGDSLSSALRRVGVTEERVSLWTGAPCGCSERRARFNALDAWGRRVVGGIIEGALAYLERLLAEGEQEP
jgi:hypothetical protein